MVVPVNKVVHVLVTGADVIHSFTVPSFGIRMDAIPSRVNETSLDVIGRITRCCGLEALVEQREQKTDRSEL
jgi:hypothetical protein